MEFISEGYPEHPDTTIIKNKYYTSGLKEIDIWNHYNKFRKDIIKFADFRPILLFIMTDAGYIVRRKMANRPIIINDSNFDDIITGRTVSVSVELRKKEDYLVVDIDPPKNKREDEIKEAVNFVLNSSINKINYIKNHSIYSSANGYHVYFNLKKSVDLNSARKQFTSILRMDINNNNYTINAKAVTNKINIDFTTMYYKGSHTIPNALCRNGLWYKDVTKEFNKIEHRNLKIK